MVEEANAFRVDVTQEDVQSVMNENPVVALQVQVKALVRRIRELTEKNERLASELEDAKNGMSVLPNKEAVY
jgi:predicted RNase H-like nuclease (RuvC/YqgF family)